MGNPMAHFFMFMDELYVAGAWMHKSNVLQRKIIILLSSIFICSNVSAESLREFHQRQCKQGKQESCERAADMLKGEQHAERIVMLGDRFAAALDRLTVEEDNKPMLGDAYLLVLDDYFKREANNGIKKGMTDYMLALCADHYHDYWRNRKMWWPSDDAGRPDWSTIYYYIVDHYYGYCLRQSL